jgi:hypothetical protein
MKGYLDFNGDEIEEEFYFNKFNELVYSTGERNECDYPIIESLENPKKREFCCTGILKKVEKEEVEKILKELDRKSRWLKRRLKKNGN